MHDRELGGRVRVAHYVALVVVATIFDVIVIVRVAVVDASGPWAWIAIAGIAILAAAVVCLVLAVKRVGPFRP